jgi:hypothetical protein
MNQLSGMTLTTRHRAAFHLSELMPAQLVHRPTAAHEPIPATTPAANPEQPRHTCRPLT